MYKVISLNCPFVYRIIRCTAVKYVGGIFWPREGGGGGTYHDLGYWHAAGVPEPHPIHQLREVEKTPDQFM